MRNIISVEGLSMVFNSREGAVHALEEVNLEANEGEFLSIVGPSGCGKSTLLRTIAGLLRPTLGRIMVDGSQVTGPTPNVGIVFQNPVLMSWRTVVGNVMLQAEVRRLDLREYRERALGLMKMVGLSGFEDKYPYQLSGGMQQRASICRALIHDPPLLLMDEPFGALDALTRERMNLELLRIWRESRKTILFITHSIPEAVFLSDRVAIMSPRPGHIDEMVPISLARPRVMKAMEELEFSRLVAHIRRLLKQEGIID
ncbi:MAG: ABC transporter ATP-binding protein [Deltaproteobacteria bacterium]|nr:ABC transporter ATP-binding protein [Deltaproteobacteria bacterium]